MDANGGEVKGGQTESSRIKPGQAQERLAIPVSLTEMAGCGDKNDWFYIFMTPFF
jgi:hypothetical protein